MIAGHQEIRQLECPDQLAKYQIFLGAAFIGQVSGDQNQIGLPVQPMQMRDRVAEQLIRICDPFVYHAGRADMRVRLCAISMTVAIDVAFRSVLAVF